MKKNKLELNKNYVGFVISRSHIEGKSKDFTSKFTHIASSQRAITLISLIIAIIIMLILVGVTVTVALKGRLFSIAKQATNGTKNEISAEETLSNGRVKIEETWYDSIEDYINGNKSKNQNDREGNWKQTEDGSITDGRVTLQIGDYVNYEKIVKKNPVILTSESKIIQDLQTYSGYTGTNYEAEYPLTQETELKWRVLDVKNGNIRLISEEPTTSKVYLRGYNGYNNSVYLLDEVCSTLYSTDKGKAQDLKIEDIEDKIDTSKYDYTQCKSEYVDTGKYGGTKEYAEEGYRYYPEIFAKEKTGWVDDKQGTEYDLSEQDKLINQPEAKKAESKIKITQTYWDRIMQESDWNNKIYHNIFIKDVNNTDSSYDTYWLSSRCVKANSTYVDFRVHSVYVGHLNGLGLCYSYKNYSNNALSVRPVVSLSFDIKIGDKVEDTWQIKE